MKVLHAVVTLLLIALCEVSASSNTPVGMGDHGNSLGMKSIEKLIHKHVGANTYVVSLVIGSEATDVENGFLMPIAKQIDMVSAQLRADAKLANGFNAIGFSQGGQFLRAVVQEHSDIKMKNLITFGGQHQGVFGLPHCLGNSTVAKSLCHIVRMLLDKGSYSSEVQKHVVQAEYWHDPTNIPDYLKYNIWLPRVNNEYAVKNSTYKANLQTLDNFVMVKFLNDTMVLPRSSEWFGFYNGEGETEHSLQDSKLYKEDWLGLQKMDKANKLHFLSSNGDHLQFTDKFFIDHILPFLMN